MVAHVWQTDNAHLRHLFRLMCASDAKYRILRMRMRRNLELGSTFDADASDAYECVKNTHTPASWTLHTEERVPLRHCTHAYAFFDADACVCVKTHPV